MTSRVDSVFKYMQFLFASFLVQKKVFFFLLWSISVCLLGVSVWGVVFFDRSFPLWYVAPLVMVVFPFMLSFIWDKKEYFHTEEKESFFWWKVFLLLLLVWFFGLFVQNPSLDLLFWLWLLIGLFFGMSGKLSFWGALCLLFATVLSLLLDQQVYAEQYSVFLYYLLCIGVFCELVGKTFVSFLDQGLARFQRLLFGFLKMFPSKLHHIWREYGKEMFLIVYIACMGLVFFFGVVAPQSFRALYLLALFFVLVLWVAGKEGCNFLLLVLKWFAVCGTIVFFLLWGWSFLSPEFVFPYWGVFLFVWLLGVLVDWFLWERQVVINADFFALSSGVSHKMFLGAFLVLILLTVAYFAGWKVWVFVFVVWLCFALFSQVNYSCISAFFKALFD